MKNRIVLWGSDEKDQKVLLGLELLSAENKVKILSFDENLATEVFYNDFMKKWRNNEELALPEGYKEIVRELSVTDDLLPETIKVERTDVINRAKTEWHFAVLSSKMYEMYKGEVEGIKDKVDQLSNYDKELWNEIKEFWSKVQVQVRERNLYRDHANTLRKITDSVFDSLKKLRKTLDQEFEKISKESVNTFFGKLETIEGKIDKGLGLQPIFNELKKIQSEFRDAKFTKGDRNKVWNRMDTAFKAVKEKRFGEGGGNQSAASRLSRRYDGLLNAITKMERSIKRDKGDQTFENRKIDQSDGQLESQIRQAKLNMINERIASKEVKLADMIKTKLELENKIEQEKKREAKRAEKAKVNEVKEELKAKVKSDIEAKQKELSPEEKEKLEKAASEIVESKKKKKPSKKADKDAVAAVKETPEPGLMETLTVLATDAIEDVVDTVKAVKEVVEDKIEDAIEAISEEE